MDNSELPFAAVFSVFFLKFPSDLNVCVDSIKIHM